MPDVQLTWLGHAAFRFDTPGGKRIYVDPFLNGNPKCPESELEPERVDVIALTHGHGDHVGDTVELAKKHGCTVVAPVELAGWLGKQGVDEDKCSTRTRAAPSTSTASSSRSRTRTTRARTDDGKYMGEPCGIVVEVENGTKLYFAGDTCVFGDMQLIAASTRPTSRSSRSATTTRWGRARRPSRSSCSASKRCVPCHYGTFPPLIGTPEQLRELAPRRPGRASWSPETR